MTFDPNIVIPSRLLLVIVGLALLTMTSVLPTSAHEDVDLKPADFVQDEPVAIRVDALRPGMQGSDVSATILNCRKSSAEAVVECTLYDADREDLGVATGRAIEVPAGERMATTVTGAEAAKFAECRVRDVK